MLDKIAFRTPEISHWKEMELTWSNQRIDTPPGRFSDAEVEEKFVEWKLTGAARQLVRLARKGKPAREVQSFKGNVITRYPSLKMGGQFLSTESQHAEYPAVIGYDFDNFTREIYCQPFKETIVISVQRKRSGGKTSTVKQPYPCTPDVMCITDSGIYLDEWKTKDELLKLVSEHPLRFKRTDSGWHCPEREAHFTAMGMTYRLRSAEEHNPTFTQNLRHLKSFLSPGAAEVSDVSRQTIQALVSADGFMSLHRLLKHVNESNQPWHIFREDSPTSCGFVVDDVLKCIARQHVFVDWYHDDISNTRETVICSSREQLELVKMTRPKAALPSLLSQPDFMEGTQFIFQASVCVVKIISNDMCHFEDGDGRQRNAAMATLATLLHKNELQIISSPNDTSRRLSAIPYISNGRIAEGWTRLQLVKASSMANITVPITIRTLQRYRKIAREAGPSDYDKILALIPMPRSGGRRQISDANIALIEEVAALCNSPTNPLTSSAFIRYLVLAAERDIHPVGKTTFYERMAPLIDVKAREGARVAYQITPIVWYLLRDAKPQGTHPFGQVHIDHTQCDVVLSVADRDGRIHRYKPWLTVILDGETRAVLGFYLSPSPPSLKNCMMAIRDMVERYNRMPSTLFFDNGSDLLSEGFTSFLMLCGTEPRQRPPHEARFGSVMERLFGTTTSEIFDNLVGASKLLKKVREVTRSVDPMRIDNLNFAQLHGILDFYFFDSYNNEIHPAHGHTPNEYMTKRFRETGYRLNNMVKYDERFRIETCLPPGRISTRVVDPARGIKVNHFWYQCSAFADRRLKLKAVEVRIDMWNPAFAYALIQGEWVRCVCKLLMELRRLTSIELRYAVHSLYREFGSQLRILSDEKKLQRMRAYVDAIDTKPILHAMPDAAKVYSDKSMVETAVPALFAPSVKPLVTASAPQESEPSNAKESTYGKRRLQNFTL